jgi:hypothetical protein
MDEMGALRLFGPWARATHEVTASLGDRSALISELMTAISTKTYGPLTAKLPADVAPIDEVQFWSVFWPRYTNKLGPYRQAELIDTVIVEGAPRTLVRLRFDRGFMIVAMVHRPGDKVFIDVIPRAFYPEVYLAPAGPGAFQAYYPTTRRGIRVSLAGETLMIGTEAEQTAARRIAAP